MARKPHDTPDQPRVGEGRLDRRGFLKHGAALAAVTTPAGAQATQAGGDLPWLHVPGQPFSAYGQPSPHERYTARRIGANRAVAGNGVSFTPLEDLDGTITPNGLHFERHHNGVPQIDPAQHRLVVHGRVRQALSFDVKSLLRYPMRSQMLFIECGGNSNAGWHAEPIQRPAGSVHGLVSCAEWTGVPLSILLEEAGVDPGASWVIAEGADAGAMNMSIPLGKMREDCLIALYVAASHGGLKVLKEAIDPARDWKTQVEHAMGAYLGCLASNPALLRTLTAFLRGASVCATLAALSASRTAEANCATSRRMTRLCACTWSARPPEWGSSRRINRPLSNLPSLLSRLHCASSTAGRLGPESRRLMLTCTCKSALTPGPAGARRIFGVCRRPASWRNNNCSTSAFRLPAHCASLATLRLPSA